MKATGIVRKMDDLGRIVIPSEIRDVLGLNDRAPVEVFIDGEMIVLRKYTPGCHFCGEHKEKYIELRGKRICENCLEEALQK